MNIYYICALLAALTWAITPIMNTHVVRHTGVMTAIRWKTGFATIMLWAIVAYNGTINSVSDNHTLVIACLSGFIGVFLGDTALYSAIKHLGGRRVTVIFTLAAPFAMILGAIFLSETLKIKTIVACIVILLGIITIIIAKEDTSKNKSSIDTITGSLLMGVFWAVLAAFCQAVGIVLARPILESGVDPIAFSSIRLTAALIPLIALRYIFPKLTMTHNPMQSIHIWYLLLIGLLGLVLGMTLTMFALTGGKVGIVTTLTSTAPAFALPIVWYKTKTIPSIWAWSGTIIVLIGTSVLAL